MTNAKLDALIERKARAYYEMVDNNDVEGLIQLFTVDAVYERPGYPAIRGHDGLRNFYSSERVIESGKHSVVTLVCQHPYVAVHGQFEGRLYSGKDVSLRFADFFVGSSDGQFTRRDTFFFTPLV